MKAVVVIALFLACANASNIDNIQKLVPSLNTPFIIQGEPAAPKSAPYIVSLGTKFEKHSHICGGSIINKEWVLTAAHCVSEPVGMSVFAGVLELSDKDIPSAQHRQVDFGRKNKNYPGGVAPNDIALLHVSEPFEFNEFVQPVVIPARDNIASGATTMYGWGQTKYWLLTAAKTLQTVKTEIVDWDDCKDVLPDDAPLDVTNVCSSSLDSGISACNGDSGGPLVKEVENGPAELIGIASWVYIPCGKSNLPSMFTRVSAHVGWIADIQSAYYTLF